MSDTLKPIFTWRTAILDSGLSPVTRHVALTLAIYMNERGGSAYPGPTRLAHDTGLHISTVRERLAELEHLGWLLCTQRGGLKGESKRANEYEASIPPTPLPIASGDPSPTATHRPDRADPSPTAHAPIASGEPILPLNSPVTRGARKRAGTPCPEEFKLNPEDREWAEQNAPTVDVTMSTKQFVTYWRSTGGLKVRWEQAWRNWLLKDEQRNANGRQSARTFL